MYKISFYKLIFWTGYIITLVFSCLPVAGDLSKIKIGIPSFHVQLDQVLHFIVYLFIMLFYLFGLRRGLEIFKKHSLRKFFISILILAVITECIQLFVPARTFNAFDLVANVAGIGVGTGIVNLVRK